MFPVKGEKKLVGFFCLIIPHLSIWPTNAAQMEKITIFHTYEKKFRVKRKRFSSN